jgi:hypothetical protein
MVERLRCTMIGEKGSTGSEAVLARDFSGFAKVEGVFDVGS